MAAWKRFPIGFHMGPGGNANGIVKDFMLPIDATGNLLFTIKSVDENPTDAIKIAKSSGKPHTIVWRSTAVDVPDYNKAPGDAAKDHFENMLSRVPTNLDRELVWVEAINEVDKSRSSWLGQFAIAWDALAEKNGFEKRLYFGWSSGEPEPEHWMEPGMIDFLRYASERRANVGVSLHEYSYDINDIYRWYPHLIGRYQKLNETCDLLGIPRVTIMISEWGWEYQTVPEVNIAMSDIDSVAREYAQNDNFIGAALWYLGGGYGEIAALAQKLIAPVGDLAISWQHYVEHEWPPGSGEEPAPDCIETNEFTKTHILRPQTLSDDQWTFIINAMESGVELPGLGNRVIGYEGWSHIDAIGAIRRSVEAGFTDSRLVIVDGHQIGTGLDGGWMEENCPLLLPHTVWLETGSVDPEPGEFKFDVWPTDHFRVTQPFGVRPDYYSQFGLPGHEGVDIEAPYKARIKCVAPGTVYAIETAPIGHNYGIHVRVQHQDGWKTIYAHMESVTVALGQTVNSGDVIGYANSTGNSSGSHLHLTLKKDGETYTDDNGVAWPYNIFDPTPFLLPLCESCFSEPEPPPTAGIARLGLHASADGKLAAGELAAFQEARIEMIKFMSTTPAEDVSALAGQHPTAPVIVRAFLTFQSPNGIRSVSPQEFFDWTYADVMRTIDHLPAGSSPIAVELHNEPNLVQEGFGASWVDGHSFAWWMSQVALRYRDALPASVGLMYPGLSPGQSIPGVREDAFAFMHAGASYIDSVDYVGCHAYWAANYPMELALDWVDKVIAFAGERQVFVTEASNNKAASPEQKGAEYIQFCNELKKRPTVGGVTYFIASATNPIWDWNGGSGEVWVGTSIPAIVGAR